MSPEINILAGAFIVVRMGAVFRTPLNGEVLGNRPGSLERRKVAGWTARKPGRACIFRMNIGIGHWGDRNKNPPRSDRLSVAYQERTSGTRKQQTLVVVAGETISRSDEVQAVLAL